MPFQLGRKIPLGQFDYGNFRAVVGSDGITRYFPRLGKHTDLSLQQGLNAAPPVDWSVKAMSSILRMFLNDQEGDCVIASRGHQIGVWTGNDAAAIAIPTDSEIHSTYQSFCGRGDNGCDMGSVNDLWASRGIPVNGVLHKIDGAVAVDHTNVDLVKVAITVFGTLSIGMNLPNAWFQSANNSVWDVTNTSIVGGHEVAAVGFNDTGVIISTWGGKRTITWAAFTSGRWIDELYTFLAPDWYGSDKLAPNGIDAATLKADLALIAGGKVPPLPGPNPPPVVPPVPPPPVVPPVVPPLPPVPPVPPVPPPTPVTLPTYQLHVWGTTAALLGTRSISLSGIATPNADGKTFKVSLHGLLPIGTLGASKDVVLTGTGTPT